MWVREVVGGGAPAPLLAPRRHGALGPGPTGPPAAPPAAGRPVPPVGAGDSSVPAPPAAPHLSGGPQGAGLGPPSRRAAELGEGGLARGGQAPGVSMARGGCAAPPPQPVPGRPPPSCASPRRGGLRCGPADAAGRGPPRPPTRPLSSASSSSPPPPATSSFLSGTLTSPSGDSGPFPKVNPFGGGGGAGAGGGPGSRRDGEAVGGCREGCRDAGGEGTDAGRGRERGAGRPGRDGATQREAKSGLEAHGDRGGDERRRAAPGRGAQSRERTRGCGAAGTDAEMGEL